MLLHLYSENAVSLLPIRFKNQFSYLTIYTMKYILIFFLFVTSNFLIQAQQPYFPQRDAETSAWKYVDVSGEQVLKIDLLNIEDLRPFSDSLACAQDVTTHLWGYINTLGKWQIKPTHQIAADFIDGYAIVTNKCKSGCNKSKEGLLNDNIGSIIDKNGLIVFTDKSQNKMPYERYFLDKNIGSGLFSVILGYGLNDMKNLINIKGELLCETYSIFGGYGNVVFDQEIKAYRCKNRYYNLKGVAILDLSKYTYVQSFSNGYIWANEETEEGTTWKILINTKGKEIARFDDALYSSVGPVANGGFTYESENSEAFYYNLASKEKTPYSIQPLEIEQDYRYTIGDKELNGCRFFYSNEEVDPKMLGFINVQGSVFYK